MVPGKGWLAGGLATAARPDSTLIQQPARKRPCRHANATNAWA